MSDEEVIRRRLIIDGDGTGDDRRLNVLLKNIIKWANYTDESSHENHLLYDRMLAQISQCEFSTARAQLLAKTNKKQLENYQKLQKKLDEQIKDVKNTIELSKQNLTQAKVLKQNRVMYDLLAQSIQQQPARKDTDKRLSELKTELKNLHTRKRNLDQRLEMRRKQFHVLVSSANQLRSMLEDATDDDCFDNDGNVTSGAEPMSE